MSKKNPYGLSNDAARASGMCAESIKRACNGLVKTKPRKGFFWSYG